MCQEEIRLRELVRSIHLNPLWAGLVADLFVDSDLAAAGEILERRCRLKALGYDVARGEIEARAGNFNLKD